MQGRTNRHALVALVTFLSISAIASQARAAEPEPTPPAAPEPERERGNPILMYLPNRLFDIFDLVRLRVRAGPGFALSARATEVLDATMGGYTSIFVGLRGPRGEPRIPWPAGIEKFAGVEVSVAGGSDEARFDPHYGAFEVGAGVHLVLLGVDVGVEPMEALDLVLGFLFIDIAKDDY